MPFNVGDRIRCVRSYNNRDDHGVVGVIYQVTSVSNEWHTLQGLPNRSVSDTRFELVEAAPVDPVPPPLPEVIDFNEPVSQRITDTRYVVVWCWHEDNPTNSTLWEYEIWTNQRHAEDRVSEINDDTTSTLIGTKKITLSFNVEI